MKLIVLLSFRVLPEKVIWLFTLCSTRLWNHVEFITDASVSFMLMAFQNNLNQPVCDYSLSLAY